MTDDDAHPTTLTRRQLLRGGAVAAGTLAWTAPQVTAFAPPAAASTHPLVRTRLAWVPDEDNGGEWVATADVDDPAGCQPEGWQRAEFVHADLLDVVAAGDDQEVRFTLAGPAPQEEFESGVAVCAGGTACHLVGPDGDCGHLFLDFRADNAVGNGCSGLAAAYLVVCD